MKRRWTQEDEENLMALRKIFTIINKKKREAARAEWSEKMRVTHPGRHSPQPAESARI